MYEGGANYAIYIHVQKLIFNNEMLQYDSNSNLTQWGRYYCYTKPCFYSADVRYKIIA